MELWQRLERIIPTGKSAADVAAMRTKAGETTGDEC